MTLFGLNKSLKHSWHGLKALMSERAFKQELILGLLVLVVAYIQGFQLYIFSSYCLVLITEALNTGIECAIDRVSTESHPISKKAKDVASFAVLISLIHLIVVLCYAIKDLLP